MPGDHIRALSDDSDRFVTGSPSAPLPMRAYRRQISGHALGVRYFSQDDPPPLDALISYSDTMYNATGRSISSTSTMLSTPINHIRSVQLQRHQDRARQHASKPPGTPKPASTFSKNGRLLKTKLLNLLQSLKRFIHKNNGTSVDGPTTNEASGENNFFQMLQKISGYDYWVFSHNVDKDRTPLMVRESQIKAWESAEKITASVIFADSPDVDIDLDSDMEISEEPLTTSLSTTPKHEDHQLHLLSLPGYTRPELDVVLKLFLNDRPAARNVDSFDVQQKSKRENCLNEHREEVQAAHERAFRETRSFATRRQIQIAQKRELIARVFGYNNLLNTEYLTNNSCYLALDNSSNLQKVVYEDKAEMGALLEEEQAFAEAMSETEQKFKASKHMINWNFSPADFQTATNGHDTSNLDRLMILEIIATRLDKIYHNLVEPGPNRSVFEKPNTPAAESNSRLDSASDDEIQNLTIAHLRLCVRQKIEPKFSIPQSGE